MQYPAKDVNYDSYFTGFQTATFGDDKDIQIDMKIPSGVLKGVLMDGRLPSQHPQDPILFPSMNREIRLFILIICFI